MPSNISEVPDWALTVEKGLLAASAAYIRQETWITRLYHYTTVEGLEGIIRSNALWSSSVYCLNDSSEMDYGRDILQQVFGEWLSANKNNEGSTAVRALSILQSLFNNPAIKMARDGTIFVTCFCEEGNLLSQWRTYGQRGGYAIGFDLQRDSPRVGPDSPFYTVRLAQVIYDRRIQIRLLHAILTDLLPMLEDADFADRMRAQSAEDQVRLLSRLTFVVSEIILEALTSFKNPAFCEEREWRLVVRPRPFGREQDNQKEQLRAPAHHFRSARSMLVPFLHLMPSEGKLPITDIRAGPSIDRKRAEASLLFFLISNGFNGVKISGSDIPVLL